MTVTPLRILILEDNPSDAELMVHEIRVAGFDPVWLRVDSEEDYLARLDPTPDVILADYTLPQFDALRALLLLQERDLDVPFLVITGTVDEEVVAECMRRGAADYLLKDRLGRLGQAVRRALGEKQVREEKRRAERALRESEARYRAVSELTSDFACSLQVTPEGEPLVEWITEAFGRMTGLIPQELGTRYRWAELIHPEDRPAAERLWRTLTAGQPDRGEFRILARWGEPRLLSFHGRPVWDDADRRVVRIYGAAQDITDRRREEARTAGVARLYRVLSNVNETVVRLHEREPLLREACRTAVEDGGLQAAWVALIDPASGILTPAARWGKPEERDRMMALGHEGTTSRTEGHSSVFALWLGTQAAGVLGVSMDKPGLLGTDETNLLEEVAARISFALESMEREGQKRRAEEELAGSLQRLKKAMAGTVQAMARATEMRDPYTAGHQRRVARLSCAIAREMGLSEERIEGIQMAASIHDIGKISVPAEILSKPGRLNEFEFSIIKTHPQCAGEILLGIEFPWPIAEVVAQHHERMNGSGYPQGLRSGQILLEARVLAVADVVEAMASHRPYRPALGIEPALREITANQGKLYDPEVVDACLKACVEGGFSFEGASTAVAGQPGRRAATDDPRVGSATAG